jgi:hypothetical protein
MVYEQPAEESGSRWSMMSTMRVGEEYAYNVDTINIAPKQ